MKNQWKLEELYKGFNDLSFISDSAALLRLAKEISDLANGLEEKSHEKAKISRYLSLNEEFETIYSKLFSYASFRFSFNTNDEEAMFSVVRIKKIRSSLEKPKAYFGEFIGGEKIAPLLKSEEFKEYSYYLQDIKNNQKYRLSPREEELLSSLELTGSQSWGSLQAKLTSKALSKDSPPNETAISKKEQRKEAFERLQKNCKEIESVSACALNCIKGEALSVSVLRGFSSPLQQALNGYHFDEEILSNLMGSIEDFLPQLRQYFSLKAKILGYENGLPYFERETPCAKNSFLLPYDDAREVILGAFADFSPRMYQYGKDFFGNDYIDYKCRAFKEVGASCDGVRALKQSRIRMNYEGTVGDGNNLAHELGHGYHNLNLFNEGILNYRYDLPVAETASKFSEILFKNRLGKGLNPQYQAFCQEFTVSGYINTIIDITSRFYFEEELFRQRKNAELSAQEIKEIMEQAQIKSYGGSLDPNFLGGFMWITKPHYYNAKRNFYNFPYSFGTLLSIKMQELQGENPKAFAEKYDLFLSSTGKHDVYNLCKLLNFDLRSPSFFLSPLKHIVTLLEELKVMLEK